RHLAEGQCAVCPEPLDRNSVRYCTDHLTKMRMRYKPKGAETAESILWLVGEKPETRHGRQPGSLARLEMGREKRTRALLAELGIPPESAAVSLNATKEALLKHLPEMKGMAKTLAELMDAGTIPTKTTAQKALAELMNEGLAERIGEGRRGDPYRYFKGASR